MQDLRSGNCDCRPERDILRTAAANEAKLRAAVEQRKQVVLQKRAELEAKVLAAEEELQAEKQAAMDVHEQVAQGRRECSSRAKSLRSLWPEVEEASAAVQRLDEEVASTREQAEEVEEGMQERLEASGCLYRIAAAATGVHWDAEAQGQRGYVAMDGHARHFDVAGLDAKAAADAIWEEIEACLPPSPKLD